MSGRRCAFLTMADTRGWTIDADLGIPPLEALGWDIDVLSWRSPDANWDEYDAVYVGTPWDYPEDPERFMSVLNSIEESNATLVNDLSLLQWSMNKTYLRDLEAGGVPIVPSIWHDAMRVEELECSFDEFAVDRIIVKPVISTNAADTYLLTRHQLDGQQSHLQNVFRNRPFVVQPFMQNILREGEFSLFYFNREFSHAIQKVPQAKDFRVQEEYGATIAPVVPTTELRAAGDVVLALVEPMPVYARVDFVRGEDNVYLTMELELVEPSLYLRTNSEAPRRFAKAINDYAIDAKN